MKKQQQQFPILLIFILFLYPAIAQSQVLKGTIKDGNTNPIENAVVALQDLATLQFFSKHSNEQGDFLFDSLQNGRYQIQVKAIGFNRYTDTLQINQNQDLATINLVEETNELEGITIQMDKPVIKNTAEGITVNIAESYLKTLPSTMDVLQQIPEVFIQDQEISILGKSKIGYYVNGKQAALNIANIPVSSIDRIEVISNPSAKYDADLEAIINLILKKSTTQGVDGEISSRFEQRTASSYGLNSIINYNKNIFNSTFTIAHNYNKSVNNYLHSTYDYYEASKPFTRESNQYRTSTSNSQTYAAEISLNFKDDHILSFLTTWQPNHIPSSQFVQQNLFKTQQSTDSISNSTVDWKYNTRYFNSGLKYDFNIQSLSLSVRFDLLWQDDSTNTYNDFRFDGFQSVSSQIDITTNQFRKSTAYVPGIDASYTTGNNSYDFGIKYYNITSLLLLDFSQNNQFTPISNFDYNAKEGVFAAYGLFNSKYKNLSYQLGLRAEFSTLNGNFNVEKANQKVNKLLPSVNFNYSIDNFNTIQLSYTEKIQRPSFSRISPLYYFTSPFDAYEGNPYLLPQYAQSLQLKYSYRKNNLSFFYNNYTNDMATIPINRNGTIVQKYANVDFISFGGIASLNFKHTTWLDGQYTFRINQQRKNGIIEEQDFSLDNFFSSISLAENIKFDDTFKMSILFSYTQPSLRGIQKVQDRPNLNFSFNKSFNTNIQLSLYLRDPFRIAHKTVTTRDLDGIRYEGLSHSDSRGAHFSLLYKFNSGKKTDTRKLTTDEARSRL